MGLLDFANNGLLGVAKNRVNKYAGLLGDAINQGANQIQSEYGAPGTDKFRENIMNMALNFAPVTATVFHGSPHKFDAFDMSKIGTGEGAQAYGHGLYFAEAPEVAKGYQASTTKGFGLPDGKTQGVAHVIALRGEEAARKIYAELGDQLEPTIEAAKKAIQNNSSLYTVDLPDEAIAKMLDWDKPLSEQAPEVRAAIKQYVEEIKSLGMEKEAKDVLDAAQMTGMPGDWFYNMAKQSFGAQNLSQDLARHGIPGIRYLDGGSRGSGQGTYNYVVFDDKLPKILKRE